MSKPNIFNYATSELSQDAVICYFAKWADPTYKGQAMHEVGKQFVFHLLQKCDSTISSIKNIKIKRQEKKIDVLLLIEGENQKIALIIEDKTNTRDHENQLQRYKEHITKKYPEYTAYGIYFKTSDQSDLFYNSDVKDYKTFLRQDIFAFYNSCSHIQNIEDTIYIDFKQYLQKKEDEVNAWQTKTIEHWTPEQWIGLYKYLQQHNNPKNDMNWRYVANPSGGFWGAWWYWNKWSGIDVYLQIQQGELVFKMIVADSTIDKSQIRNQWYHIIKQNISEESKPARFSEGSGMVAYTIPKQIWLGDSGVIDIKKVIKNLQKYQTVLKTSLTS